jgi:hypothetical protein
MISEEQLHAEIEGAMAEARPHVLSVTGKFSPVGDSSSSSQRFVEVVTLGERRIRAGMVVERGWYVLDSNVFYPTLHQLLMGEDPEHYMKSFHALLSAKLSAVATTQSEAGE